MIENNERAKELEREYLRKWRQKNKDKMRQYRKNYWLKKANQEQEGGRENESAKNSVRCK